jgi:hypothetical protein
MLTRREMLKTTAQLGAALALSSHPVAGRADEFEGVEINDVQSQLNATRVNRVIRPKSIDDVQAAPQLAGNFDAYREAVDKERGTEMITEAYVTKDAFLPFMARAREE